MTIKRVSSGPGLPPGFPFSLASEANGILFISGMPALDAAGKFAPGTFQEEADRAWANVAAIAEAGGYTADFSDLKRDLIVEITIGQPKNTGAKGASSSSSANKTDDKEPGPEKPADTRPKVVMVVIAK